MIDFHFETEFGLDNKVYYADWIGRIIASEAYELDEVNYIFCDDAYLLKINQEYLDHDTFTDIITFDYSAGNRIGGDVFISVERVKENADIFKVTFDSELRRVMAHGVLHLIGFKDKSEEESNVMRSKENEKMKLFHVEQ